MVARLFAGRPPHAGACLLDPGCGNGEFIEGVLRVCVANRWQVPQITGVELDARRAKTARTKFRSTRQVTIETRDFLQPAERAFDYIIGNPPYVSILDLSVAERLAYRAAYRTARGRFDLYVLFFEQALRVATPGARVVFITPEKFLYVQTAAPLRELLRSTHVEELDFASESTFAGKVTYPLITSLTVSGQLAATRVIRRDGSTTNVTLPASGSWLPAVEGFAVAASGLRLEDIALRVSCGVATGADSVFVIPTNEVPVSLREFAYPTVSGRQILPSGEVALSSSLLAPYDARGALLSETALGPLGAYLSAYGRKARLMSRTCSARKAWYAYHDNMPLSDMLRPKLLCKDITERPFFVVDADGTLVPRHSVYYVVPNDEAAVAPLAEYLNSEEASAWLRAHCQRAASGFLRMQSHVLKQLPLPAQFAKFACRADYADGAGSTLTLLPA